MSNTIWTKEIMSLKVSSLAHKDITKILILLYIVTNKLLNCIIKIEDINR